MRKMTIAPGILGAPMLFGVREPVHKALGRPPGGTVPAPAAPLGTK
jgi:hypothetical protein